MWQFAVPAQRGGVVNIVFRNGFEGVEVVAGGEVPAGTVGDTAHASVLWGGPAGAGHLTIGVDAFQRRKIRSADRDYSRSTWTPGGSFADAVNVSVSGNTAFTVGPDVDADGDPVVTAHSLGECTGDGFTGPLSEPFEYDGVGCGFAYGNSGWVWERRERQALFVGYEAPASGDERVYFETRVSEGTTHAPSYAPPFTVLTYSRPDCTNSNAPADCQDRYGRYEDFAVGLDLGLAPGTLPDAIVVRHRLAGHGERGSRETVKEYDATIGLRGSIAPQTNFDAHIRAYRHSRSYEGGDYVRKSLFDRAVAAGIYDLTDPLDPGNAQAVQATSVRLNREWSTEHRVARAALDGILPREGAGAARWIAGVELAHERLHRNPVYSDLQGNPVSTSGATDFSELIGTFDYGFVKK